MWCTSLRTPRWKPRRRLPPTGVSSKEQRQAIAEAIKGVKFTTAFGKILQRLLRTGVGIHHAGMLPRYRRLVEQLAQQGLLPVICGTDTLGVGINVPIHSVVLTALTKFDGTKMRRLRAREFHQIGRTSRSYGIRYRGTGDRRGSRIRNRKPEGHRQGRGRPEEAQEGQAQEGSGRFCDLEPEHV